uniref:Uncharacterized protein n=1 Tax=viral metagenome TaxID=1070528 RepID=A0A6C0HKS0_9ZZZZ
MTPVFIGILVVSAILVLMNLKFLQQSVMKLSSPAPLQEGFEEKKDTSDYIMDYPPNGPSPADVYTEHPYHLLRDILPTASSGPAMSSRSCYETDFEQATSKTGTYRQLTNNFKRSYPDNCSTWNQNLLLSFYKPTL